MTDIRLYTLHLNDEINVYKKIYTACLEGNIKKIGLLFDKHPEKINEYFPLEISVMKWTPLLMAVNNGQLEIIKLLIDKGANINKKSFFGFSPIHIAVLQENINIVIYLLKIGVYIDLDILVENSLWDNKKYYIIDIIKNYTKRKLEKYIEYLIF